MAEFKHVYIEKVEIDDDEIKAYVGERFEVSDIFPEGEIKDYIADKFGPEDIFKVYELDNWAKSNGYIERA